MLLLAALPIPLLRADGGTSGSSWRASSLLPEPVRLCAEEFPLGCVELGESKEVVREGSLGSITVRGFGGGGGGATRGGGAGGGRTLEDPFRGRVGRGPDGGGRGGGRTEARGPADELARLRGEIDGNDGGADAACWSDGG